MKMILTIAGKELRSLFASPMCLHENAVNTPNIPAYLGRDSIGGTNDGRGF